ncbi:hypothetical protein DPX16_12599 [Anabarilius grahami]|uniref:Uncharacterized protein n=1 Tax=Anabarilius grahami TaxID=495550 RepID=A0A3N0YKD9_ANAGA|nr:hypothetical protein DPX16_12599 [Anabarilius grahami]
MEPAAVSILEQKPDQVSKPAFTSVPMGILVELDEEEWLIDWKTEMSHRDAGVPCALVRRELKAIQMTKARENIKEEQLYLLSNASMTYSDFNSPLMMSMFLISELK